MNIRGILRHDFDYRSASKNQYRGKEADNDGRYDQEETGEYRLEVIAEEVVMTFGWEHSANG